MSIPIFSQKSNGWRDNYNPLRGLSVHRVVSLLEAGERGQYADLQWFYYYMERSDPMIFSILQRRLAALLDSDWDIRVPAQADEMRTQSAVRQQPSSQSGDSVLADEQAAFLREAYDRIENFRDALGFLFTGFFRGYAHLEKHFDARGGIVRLEPVEQWFWVRDGMFGGWEYNENAVSGRRRGIPIAPDNFVVLESVALNRMLAFLYLRRNLNVRNWDAFLEVYGIASVFLIGPPNTPAAKEAEYQKIAEEIISDGRGYLPYGSDLKYVNGGGGKVPFREQLEYTDKMITLVGTGGLLTLLAEPGSGTLAGGAHQDSFQQIARGDAVTLSGVLQRQVDQPLLAQFFPGKPPLAYFEFTPSISGQSSRVVQDAAQLAAAGFTVNPAEISEKSGYQVAPRTELAAGPNVC